MEQTASPFASDTSTEIATDINSVSARAAMRDGRVIVVAVNKTNRPVSLQLAINGASESLSWSLQSFAFDDLRHWPMLAIDQPVLGNELDANSSTMVLPPLSINRIEQANF